MILNLLIFKLLFNGKPTLLVRRLYQMLPLNQKRTTSSLVPPIICVAKKLVIKRQKAPNCPIVGKSILLAHLEGTHGATVEKPCVRRTYIDFGETICVIIQFSRESAIKQFLLLLQSHPPSTPNMVFLLSDPGFRRLSHLGFFEQ